jgi:hypothetical protein
MTDLTPTQLAAIRAKALSMAGQDQTPRAKALRHVARDAQYAIDADCPASLESVVEFVGSDHELSMALYEPRACEQSVIGLPYAA